MGVLPVERSNRIGPGMNDMQTITEIRRVKAVVGARRPPSAGTTQALFIFRPDCFQLSSSPSRRPFMLWVVSHRESLLGPDFPAWAAAVQGGRRPEADGGQCIVAAWTGRQGHADRPATVGIVEDLHRYDSFSRVGPPGLAVATWGDARLEGKRGPHEHGCLTVGRDRDRSEPWRVRRSVDGRGGARPLASRPRREGFAGR
jgi:hypothetical protein